MKINGIEIDVFVDFGQGFKFIAEDGELNEFGNLVLKIHPKSINWIKLEYNLEKH